MLGFFIKKTFFDGWDNLFALVGLNLVSLALVGVLLVLPLSLGLTGAVALIPVLASILAVAVWWSVCVFALVRVSDFKSLSVREVLDSIRPALVPGIQLAVLCMAGYILLSIGLPFYLTHGGLLGVFAAGILFWCTMVALLAFQYYLPLRARLGGGLRKNVRKCFILFFDNAGFSIFLLLYNLVTLVLSFFLAFMAPGIAGIALALDVGVRLRMKKYDWIEANPDANRRKVPWYELLEEDRDLVGPRTLKGMIFPWKDK